MVVVEVQLLLAVGGVLGRIQVEHEAHHPLVLMLRQKELDQRRRALAQLPPGDGVLEAGEGGLTAQVPAAVWGVAHGALEERVGPQTVRIIRILILSTR